MRDYVIFTDSGCDLSPEMLAQLEVTALSLTFRFEGEDKEYSNNDMPIKAFYDRMREGGVAKTAAVNPEAFEKAFEKTLSEGKDILYLGFSSGLSTTYNSAVIASNDLREKYPDCRIVTIDTLAASAGQGMLVYMAAEKKKGGASLDETAEYIRENVLSQCHWFTVDDLVYLKRGGRVSPTVALLGRVLGIKPVLHVDDEGHLISISKVRSRKLSIATLAEKYGELAKKKIGGLAFISHADCMDDARELADMLKKAYNATVKVITNVGTVIGAHSGPGTLALFFIGEHR